MDEGSRYKCFKCAKCFNSSDAMFMHFKVIHPLLQRYECNINGCHRSFPNLKAIRNHFNMKHENFVDISTIARDNIDDPLFESRSQLANQLTNKSPPNANKAPNVREYDINSEILAFVSSLYNISCLPRNEVQVILLKFRNLLTIVFDHLTQILKTSVSNCQHLKDMSESFISIQNFLLNFKSEFLSFKYFEQTDSFIKPETFSIGERPVVGKKKSSEQPVMVFRKAGIQVIPLRKLLKKYFELPNVFQIAQEYKSQQESASTDVLSSLFQGSLWKKIGPKFKNKIVFPLYMYFDDFECCNPLGSKAGIHKIGAVYVSLACLPPDYATLLDNIFLAELFYSEDRSSFGNERIFSKLLEEFQYLEDSGIHIEVNGNLVQVFFTVVLILGDNLGLNSILGFNESFQASFFCRFCRTPNEITKIQSVEDFFSLRTPINYEMDVKSKSFGIKEKCVFNSLPSYHLIHNCSVDLMHDMLEGILRYDMAHILHYLVNKGYFTLDNLNERIRFLNFSEVDIGNPIPHIKINNIKKKYLILSASEMLAFVNFFGILVGDLVPEDDLVWEFFINLWQILQILLSRSISVTTVEYLRYLIENHNKDYCELFSDTLKPKHHILLHYPSIILRIGPPRLIWSMRFEGFHKKLKTFADSVTTRKNIILTISLKQQLRLSCRLLSSLGIIDTVLHGPSATDISLHPDYETFKKLFNKSNVELNDGITFILSWIKINSIMYKPGFCLLTVSGELPEFGEIKFVLNMGDDIFFIVCPVITIGFNLHIQAYEIIQTLNISSKCILVSLKSILDRTPYNIHQIADGTSVVFG